MDTHRHLLGAVGGECLLILKEDAEERFPGGQRNLAGPQGVAGAVAGAHLAVCGKREEREARPPMVGEGRLAGPVLGLVLGTDNNPQ